MYTRSTFEMAPRVRNSRTPRPQPRHVKPEQLPVIVNKYSPNDTVIKYSRADAATQYHRPKGMPKRTPESATPRPTIDHGIEGSGETSITEFYEQMRACVEEKERAITTPVICDPVLPMTPISMQRAGSFRFPPDLASTPSAPRKQARREGSSHFCSCGNF